MPIKQVVCSICKETVNKAQTYHVGGTDRACKKHDGVVQKKEDLDKAKAKKTLEQLQKAEHRLHAVRGESWTQDYTPKCWVCMNTGLRSQEFYLRYWIECEKQSKITGKTVLPFMDQSIKLKERCIFLVPKDQCQAAMKYVREDFAVLVQMAGFLAICGDCCFLSKINPTPKIDLNTLARSAVLSDILQPAVQAQAARELVRDS